MKKYLPFLSGVYTTAPGLAPLSKAAEPSIFDIDESYPSYFANKEACRAEDITKYHAISDLSNETKSAVNSFILEKMLLEHPDVFQKSNDSIVNKRTLEEIPLSDGTGEKYISLFDALCSQLQEDVAVVQMKDGKDWLTAIHLCSPNHWDPRTKIGRPFDAIHAPIPEIGRTVKNYQAMLKMVIDKEPFIRFAWGIATDTSLNHHPEPPPGEDVQRWRGRRIADETTEFFVRTERQTLVGLKSVDAFIFTIRTYFYKVNDLTHEEKNALKTAVLSMSEASLEYKGMNGFKESLLKML
jgi:dimethylamine monooxygenase subunit A